MESKTISPWKTGIISGFSFFLTVAVLSVGYAAFSSGLSLSDKTSSGSILSSVSWNRLVDSVIELDGRTSGLTSSGGNLGVGTANPSTKLEVNGDLKISGGAIGTNFGQQFVSTMPNNMGYGAGGYILGSSTAAMPIGTYYYQIYGCAGQNTLTNGAIGTFVFVSGSGNATNTSYFDNYSLGGGLGCGYFRTGFIQISAANSVVQLKIADNTSGGNTDNNPTANSFQAIINRIY